MEQAEFVAEVQAQNKLSSVTFADDYPVEEHQWVEFPVYGTKYEVRREINLSLREINLSSREINPPPLCQRATVLRAVALRLSAHRDVWEVQTFVRVRLLLCIGT